ncbi:Facilitated trehalose transporter Tret1like, partial [Caligus rogercresseyi]
LRHAMESMSQSSSFSDLLKSYNLRPLFISILVMMGQQTSGINAVLSYSQNIFALTSSGMSPLMETIIMDLMMVVATLLAAGVSDRLGRRFLIIISGSTIFLSLLSIGTYYFLDSGGYPIVKSLSWLPLVSLCFHVMSFSFGYGPIPWLLMSEIFAPEIRGYASAIA